LETVSRPFVGAHTDVLLKRFRAKLHGIKYYSSPQDIPYGNVHTRIDLCTSYDSGPRRTRL